MWGRGEVVGFQNAEEGTEGDERDYYRTVQMKQENGRM
jgi:hypothetical protein